MPLPCAVAFADERLRIAQRKMESTLGSFELKPFAAPKTTSWSWHRGGSVCCHDFVSLGWLSLDVGVSIDLKVTTVQRAVIPPVVCTAGCRRPFYLRGTQASLYTPPFLPGFLCEIGNRRDRYRFVQDTGVFRMPRNRDFRCSLFHAGSEGSARNSRLRSLVLCGSPVLMLYRRRILSPGRDRQSRCRPTFFARVLFSGFLSRVSLAVALLWMCPAPP